jgi:cysteine desulfurase/selenocysteine lyase
MSNLHTIKKDFPIYESQPNLVYLDSAATALKPKVVIDAMNAYYFEYSANVARGLYPLAEGATTAFDAARNTIARFVHATNPETIVFTANATQGINLVALGLEHRLTNDNNIVVTELEHHSNFLPCQKAHRCHRRARKKEIYNTRPQNKAGTHARNKCCNGRSV